MASIFGARLILKIFSVQAKKKTEYGEEKKSGNGKTKNYDWRYSGGRSWIMERNLGPRVARGPRKLS